MNILKRLLNIAGLVVIAGTFALGCSAVASGVPVSTQVEQLYRTRQEGERPVQRLSAWELTQRLYRSTVKVDAGDMSWGSGFCVDHFTDKVTGKTVSVIVTAGHVVVGHNGLTTMNPTVYYWPGHGLWVEAKGTTVACHVSGNSDSHDIAILIVEADIPSLEVSQVPIENRTEVLVAGVLKGKQPPAIVSYGGASLSPGPDQPKQDQYFYINAWATYGESGGPVIRRSSGGVVGFVAHAPDGHSGDAGMTGCPDQSIILAALVEAGFRK